MKKISFQFILVIFILLYVSVQAKLLAQKTSREILKVGTPASAVIKKLWQTPLTVNNQPVVGLELQVIPVSGSPFVVQIHQEISLLQVSYYQPGSIVQIRYDSTALPINPEKPTKKVVIESLGGSIQSSNPSAHDNQIAVAEYTAELLKVDSLNSLIRANGISSKAVILTYNSYKNLNIKVNGNNPAITIEIEVIPDNKPSFRATASGVIMESSIPKYQPGKIVYIKYDPNDLSKVSMDHSE
ncbi:MAG TPA: hypothetical protein VK766_00700 [Cytophagaceae bacterium]|jgi:hypothetical protein|nr:hypothetical protein [Cytophagaceae bacterium]